MNVVLLLTVFSAVGVDHGWQPLTDGGVEYIIQIEPEIFDTVRSQNDVESYLPAGLDVRKIRVTVGNNRLPRTAGNQAAAGKRRGPASELAADVTDSGANDASAAESGASEPTADTANSLDSGAELTSASEIPNLKRPLLSEPDETEESSTNPSDPDASQFDANSRDAGSDAAETADSQLDAEVADPFTRRGGAGDTPRQKQSRGNTFGSGDEANSDSPEERAVNRPRLDEEPAGTAKQGGTKSAAAGSKPWLPLTITAVALCLSLGANLYLAWIARDARQRYRDLLDQVQSPTAAAA